MCSSDLLTYKPTIYAANVAEDDLADDGANNPGVQKVREFAKEDGSEVFVICAQIEQEMAQLVEENKHFTTPSKFLNEFPVALKAENEKTREELEKMQDCGKQMGVLALNAAIEAGRMGEGGKQFVTAAETIRVSAGTYDELIDQAHKRLADSDERIAELEEQVHRMVTLLKENNVAMTKLMKSCQEQGPTSR